MSSEELFYACLDRIDSDDKVAEEFLIGCIHELNIRYGNTVARDVVRRHFEMMDIEKYERHMKLILNMRDDSLCSLIASSIDINVMYRQITIIYGKIEDANYDDVTASCHAQKAEMAGNMLLEIAKKMRPAHRCSQGGLFEWK